MSGAVPSPAIRLLEWAARVPRPGCPGCGRCGRGDPAPAPQCAPLRVGVARCGGGGRASPGGVLSAVARGAWCQALSLPWPPVLWSGQPGFRVPRVPGAVGAGVGTRHRPHSVRPCGPALLAVGVAEGRPWGGAFHSCEGRLVSGALPPSAARPLERAARVPRPVCPGCGRCGCGDPSPAPQRETLWAGVARCGGGGRASPGGVLSTVVKGGLVSGAVLPPAARPLERAARVPRPVCPGCGRYGRVDPAPAPQRAPLRACVARCGGGGRASPGGVPSTAVRGAWCQALSLPRPPVLWSGQPGFRDPCVPGAVDAGVWTQHRPHSVRPCGPALLAVGVAEGRPRVGCLPSCCEGRLVSGAVPPPTACPLERAAGVPRPVCPGCGRCGRVNPASAPQRAPLRAGVARCGGGGRASPGGVPSTVVRGAWCQALSLPRPPVLWSGQPGFRDPCVPGAVDAGVWTRHRPHSVRPCGPALLAVGVAEGRPRVGCLPSCCEGRLVSGAVPPPTARPLERAAGVPPPVCPGCGRCGRVDPAPAPQCASLRAAVARCGGGGGASPGGVPSTVVRGAWCQALSLPQPSVLWSGQSGFRVPCVPGAVGAGVGTQQRPRNARALAGRRCSPWGWRKGVPGGCLPPL